MRAATVIVGAIAAASILIALSLIASGGGSGRQAVTKKVIETVEEAPRPATVEESAAPGTEGSGGREAAGGGGVAGPSNCGGGEIGVENVSCEIAEQIHEGYEEGGRGELFAQDTGETITMSCSGAAPVECKGPGGARVYFEK